jgi:hypothetical protein
MKKEIIVKLAAAAAFFALAGCTDIKPLKAEVDALKTQVGDAAVRTWLRTRRIVPPRTLRARRLRMPLRLLCGCQCAEHGDRPWLPLRRPSLALMRPTRRSIAR